MYKIRCVMRFDKPKWDVTVRAWREILRAAMTAAGYHWHRVMAPRHFKKDAHERYGYKQRKGSESPPTGYLGQPRKRGRPDLVYSWATYQAVVKGTPMVRGFPTRAQINLPVPDYIHMRPKDPDKPNLGEEIVRVTPDEAIELAEVATVEVERGIRRVHELRAIEIS